MQREIRRLLILALLCLSKISSRSINVKYVDPKTVRGEPIDEHADTPAEEVQLAIDAHDSILWINYNVHLKEKEIEALQQQIAELSHEKKQLDSPEEEQLQVEINENEKLKDSAILPILKEIESLQAQLDELSEDRLKKIQVIKDLHYDHNREALARVMNVPRKSIEASPKKFFGVEGGNDEGGRNLQSGECGCGIYGCDCIARHYYPCFCPDYFCCPDEDGVFCSSNWYTWGFCWPPY